MCGDTKFPVQLPSEVRFSRQRGALLKLFFSFHLTSLLDYGWITNDITTHIHSWLLVDK